MPNQQRMEALKEFPSLKAWLDGDFGKRVTD